MARGRKTAILISAGGLLLLLSHAAAWQLGRRPPSTTTGQAEAFPSQTRDAAPSPTDLVLRGREHETAKQEQRELEKLPWRDQVDAARGRLPTDADFPALVRQGMAAAKANRDHVGADTVAAFGKWLELDSDAALDFIGKANRRQSMDSFRFEIGDWLGRGNERRFGELVKHFPQAAWPLRQGARALCYERGAATALEIAASLPEPGDRLWLLDDCLDAKQWQGHLSRVPSLLNDPKAARRFLSSICKEAGAAALLDEIRSSGFSLEDVALAEAQIAENAEAARKRELEDEKDRVQRKESASPLRRQLGLAEASLFSEDSPSEEQQLDKQAPGFADACADLADGRQSMEEVLALVQRSWPPATDPAVEKDLRTMLFGIAFTTDPLGTLKAERAAGRDYHEEAEDMLYRLSPETAIRVISEHPEIVEDRESAAFHLYFQLFGRWEDVDPDGCRKALLAVPDEVLRSRWLERFDRNEEMRRKQSGGGP